MRLIYEFFHRLSSRWCLKHLKWEGRMLICSKCREIFAVCCDNEIKIFPWYSELTDDMLEMVSKLPKPPIKPMDVKYDLDEYIREIKLHDYSTDDDEDEEVTEDV